MLIILQVLKYNVILNIIHGIVGLELEIMPTLRRGEIAVASPVGAKLTKLSEAGVRNL